MIRSLHLVALVTLVLLAPAAPAAADAAGPTNYRSEVTAVVSDGGEPVPIEVEMLGGDAFLVLRVEPGVEVDVPGYDGEPYVRVHPDGTVEVNDRSPTRWVNDERYGERDTEVPAEADAAAPPTWVRAADDGTYAWHDHRVHFMSPALPRQVDPDAGGVQHVQDWEVPLRIDGEDVRVQGELTWVPGPSPLWPIGLAVAGLGLLVALVRGGEMWRGAATMAAVVGSALVGVSATWGLPPGADAEAAWLALPVVAGVAWLAGSLAARGRGGRLAWLQSAAAVPLLAWAVVWAGALVRPIAPTPLPIGVVRGAVSLAGVAGVLGLIGLVRAGLAATSLDRDDEVGT
ncbi:MAG: hypothetical protein WD638_09505 [Nitriliruptoraceae bacterium]